MRKFTKGQAFSYTNIKGYTDIKRTRITYSASQKPHILLKLNWMFGGCDSLGSEGKEKSQRP